MSFDIPEGRFAAPTEPEPPPMVGSIDRQKPKKKSMTPTYLGANAAPTASQLGTKTLLGQ